MMKLIAKNVTKETVNLFLDQFYAKAAYFTGDTRTYTMHYISGVAPYTEEVARITRNNDTNLYNIRVKVD